MIVLPEPCKECGGMKMPDEVRCDQCGRSHLIEGFSGIVLHFEVDGHECNHDCQNCSDEDDDEVGEFQFCSPHCLSEYITDPCTDSFSKYDQHALEMMAGPEHVQAILYALGRACDD